jgi:hypothetical protein
VVGRIPNAVNVEQQKTVGSDGNLSSLKAEILKQSINAGSNQRFQRIHVLIVTLDTGLLLFGLR